ncbi:o-succinylbenzoate--CoA ligase [Corynebacterium aquatimens]|nr:o-succinylbenzoate--CoA ligase [Corynebacterium aquatimens]WJY65033.1 2-succinylbenzoate--CoA ligase [Corynebacterium aquatimens]
MLEIVPVDPADPVALMDDLEEAIAGMKAILPVPGGMAPGDRDRAELLRTTMRAGQSIDESVAVVVATSGSTGKPKGAQLTPANLVASADATHQALGGPGQWMLALPAHHIAGLQVLTRCLVAGVEPEWVDLTQGFSVEEFAYRTDELVSTGERCYTALTPMQLTKAMSTLAGIEALRLYAAVLVGGGAINPKLLESAAKLRINAVTTYGSSETAGGCVYDGRPLAGVRVKVVGERIHLGGPTIARGYRNLPDHEAFAEDGWFATSDAGMLISDTLTVTGRLDAIIETGGLKVHPEVVEKHVLACEGVTGACVVGVPDERFGHRLCLAYTGSAGTAQLMEHFDDTLPRWQVPKDIRVVREIPVIGPGKPDRKAVAALFQ